MSNVVRDIREAVGMSQSQLARRSGVAQPNIAAYESGRRVPSGAMVGRLRAAARPLPHEALQAHRDALLRLASEYGFREVRVFGSAARGTDAPGSDLDILVSRPNGAGLMTIAAFAEAATDLLGVEVDVVTDGGLRPDHEILASALPV